MKNLGKLTLKEMRNEMPVIHQSSMKGIAGGYYNDCWWRCVSYIKNDCANYDESDAEYYANDFYTNGMGCSDDPEAYYPTYGAGMNDTDIQNYLMYNSVDPSGTSNGLIGFFKNDDISDYENDGGRHAVVITSENPDGSLNYFDPQLKASGTIPASEAENVQKYGI